MTTRKFSLRYWLLFSLIGVGALYFWLQVEFIAAVQIIVYVGGIVVLIISLFFSPNNRGKEMPKQPLRRHSVCPCSIVWVRLTFLQISKSIFSQLEKTSTGR
jgi:NADH:ubiquinone oxidoreductase subunit 6 (subunit J)